jgi:flagellar protein FlaJ
MMYMGATAAAGISRSRVFQMAAELGTSISRYLREVDTLVDSLHYDYPTACRRVGDLTRIRPVKSFLLRLSDALESGEPIASFMADEARAQADSYANQYDRDLESLKKWTDAYRRMGHPARCAAASWSWWPCP